MAKTNEKSRFAFGKFLAKDYIELVIIIPRINGDLFKIFKYFFLKLM